MKIKVRQIMKAKSTSHCETVVTSSFRACSFAMDDGGRCLADVINDPLLLQSFLESGSDDNSKDPHDGTSSESAVESPQVSRSVPTSFANHASEHIVEQAEQMGYIYTVDNQGFAVEPRVSSQSGLCSSSGLGGVSLVVASSSVGPQTYQHASLSGATIHHMPSSAAHPLHPHSPASARPATPLSSHNIKSPGQGPSSVHSMPPPSPLQQTRSPLPSHTPSPAPAWSPAPPVLSPATSRTQSMPSLAFQQSHNQILQTSCNVTQFVTAIATPQSITQKLTMQQQQQLFLQQQVSPVSQQQSNSRLASVATTAVTVTPPVVQLIPAPQSNVSLPTRTSHSNVRPIQPKLPPQILPKPATCSTSNQFMSPAPASKQAPSTPVTSGQRTVGVGIQPNATGQLVVGQGQSGVFSGPQGTILLNQIIPGVGQSPILIQGNLSNLANVQGLQLTLRPPNSASPGQSLNSSSQNNATIIAALQNTSQHTPTLFAPAKNPMHGQQTIVIPNNLAHSGLSSQNINLTSTAIPNSGIMSSSSQGQGFLRSNFILSPRLVGPNQGQFQFQQIQTPQGPILACIPSQTIAVPHLPVGPTLQNATIGNAQLAPVTLPMHGVMATGQGVISGLSLQSHTPPSALHTPQQSLFGTAVPFTSHVEQPSPQLIQVPQPMASPQLPTNHNTNQITNHPQSIEHSPKAPSPPKASKGPAVSLNLEDILKETGIVPENSPPLSPDTNSPVMEETVPSHLQASNTVVPSQQLIAASLQGQVVLEQVSQSLQGQSGVPQMKLAFAHDGSVILQPHNAFGGTHRVQQFVQSPQIQGRAVNSVIIPTVSTAPVSVSSSESSIARSHANLIARLNSPPPVSVPDVSSLGVTSIGGALSSSITTFTVTTVANTVPLTVQSVNANSLPIASTGYVMQRTNVAVGPERTFFAEDISNLQTHGNIITEISNSNQSVQRINHMNSGFQTLVVSSESIRNAMQNSFKTVQSTPSVNVSTTNCINIVQADLKTEIKTEPNVAEVNENKGAAVPSHNLPSYQNVPNQRNQVQKLQKQVNDLSSMKFRTPEQQKNLQQAHALLQKVIASKSSKVPRIAQSQIQKHEPEKTIVQRCQPVQNQLNSDQLPQQQVLVKAPIPQQQTHENNKQVSSNSNTHNMHLVNLLKQGPSLPATTKHSVTPVTTCTVTVNNTVSSTIASTVTVSTHPRIVNQVVTPPLQRLQNVHQQKSQPENLQQPQQQVIVRLPKPQPPPPPQTVQSCPNIVQLKPAPPVKKIVVNTVPKTVLFNEQLAKDQNGALCPDVETPFQSKDDACCRLLKYHVHNVPVPSFKEIEKADETFAMVSVHLLEKKKRLENKFHLLQLKESMRLCPSTDHVMLERLFIKDEEESLKEDKAFVAEGRVLSLPPPPACWRKELDESPCDMPPPPLTSCRVEEVTVKKEIEDNDGHSTEFSDPMHEDSDPVYKDDDNLEAPVIDSCADIVVPQHDENCERSPPTLKRIVIKPEKRSESDSEEILPNNKRFKCNSYYEKYEPNNCERSSEVTPSKSSVIKEKSDRESEVKTNNKYPHVPLTRESYHSDNRIDDMVTKIRKELNMSPVEMDDDDLDPVSSHVVDFEPPSGTNDLADFEPPVARTEESCDSTLLYNNSVRTNCDVKYDFEMLGCWDENYVHNPSNESDTVGNIMNDHGNPSDLDLSGLDGLDHLEESQPGVPNGIQDVTSESDMNYIGYHIPKHQKRFHDMSVQPSSNCSSSTDQMQSAIKSIMGTPADNRSYYGADEMEFLPINKSSHNTHIADYSRSLDSEMGVTNSESDAALDEAVRSILLT